ncbi:MAG: NAD(P)H-dependent oxidoreductase [Gammaproteobacteria bacterium]|nr:NAD(P)H-dependent oxidoreductase [Gammaproteobacteria bacterium]
MPNLLIVANCPSKNTRALHRAVCAGAARDEISGIKTRASEPLNAAADDVLWADGVILGTTENFGYMSGQIKDFLERVYYPCLEKTEGLPAALYVKGGLDGTGAKTSMERIIGGMKWKLVRPTLVLKGDFRADFLPQCEELGALMAAGLEAGIF